MLTEFGGEGSVPLYCVKYLDDVLNANGIYVLDADMKVSDFVLCIATSNNFPAIYQYMSAQ